MKRLAPILVFFAWVSGGGAAGTYDGNGLEQPRKRGIVVCLPSP
jgi:hypothetical protein